MEFVPAAMIHFTHLQNLIPWVSMISLKNTCLLSLFTIFSVFYASLVQAEEEQAQDWFQIEYVLFEHLASDRHVLRYEDVKYMAPEDTQYQYLYSLGKPLSSFQIAPLDTEQAVLGSALNSLKRANDIRVLSQGAWQQPVGKESAALPLKINAGHQYSDGRHQIEGSLIIKRSRYMHAVVDIYMSDFESYPYTDMKEWFFESSNESWPVDWLALPLTHQPEFIHNKGDALIERNVVHLNASRRIKDEEIHYIDHPALGMIVTVKKVDDPTAIMIVGEEIL